ncbi:hypothetical protein OHR68_29685 [Spirillospora sp. NBC_00431]
MAEAGTEEFAEFGAAALDSFQTLFEETNHLDHRNNDAHARELLGDLLIDLMHYSERRGLEFNDIFAQAHGYYLSEQNSPDVFAIGSAVQFHGPAADEAILLGQPTRGTVTGLLVPHDGPTEYEVQFIGETSSHTIIAADLESAPPFPTTPTTQGVINDALRAEETLVETMIRVAQADIDGLQQRQDDLNDRQALLDALVAWNGMDKYSVSDLLLAKVEPRLSAPEPLPPAPSQPLSPAQIAAQDFPVPLDKGLTSHHADSRSTSRPAIPPDTHQNRHR